MQSIFEPLNLALLFAAAFVVWKLATVLGQRTGNETRKFDPFSPDKDGSKSDKLVVDEQPGAENSVPKLAVWEGFAERDSELAKALEAIALESPGFSPKEFLNGAKIAYELILEAFAKGNKSDLKPLLAKEVLNDFSTAIDSRLAANQSAVMQFIGVKSAKIENASHDGKLIQVAVRFVGEMINATLDKDGSTVEGDPKTIKEVVDYWTFEKDIRSKDPNWKLIDTNSDGK